MKVQQPEHKGSEQSYQMSHWVEPMHQRGVGRELFDLTERIEGIGKRLTGILSGQLELLVHKLLYEIAGGNCKIAFLGQAKSGKSTLINSLIGNSDILPVDEKPCTTAVTRVHLGRFGAPTSGFQAHFFNQEEWQNAIEAGDTTPSQKESKIPQALIAKHFSTLTERVKQKLGADYENLLGKGHSFEKANSNILKQYISVSAESGETAAESETGKYADITKYADVFLPKSPFAFPVTLIDTPGTDDPSFMREEITRQNLQADIFVLVLTAHQTLSDADLSLIRMLHGLRKERLIIFVNRIDELSFISADAESVFHYVKHQVDHEFPGYNIPIILGSSHWSNMSLRSHDHLDYEALNTSLLPYAREIGALSNNHNFSLNLHSEIDTKFLAYILEFSSGLPRLSNVLSSQMLTSKHAANLAKVVRTLSAVTKGVMATAQQRADENDTSAIPQNTTAHKNANEYEAELRLSKSIEDTKRILTALRREINGKIQNILEGMHTELNEILENFIEGQTYELRQVIKTCQHIDKWYVNVAGLRHEIENCCNKTFALLKREFDTQQQAALVNLKMIFSEAYGVAKEDVEADPVIIGNWEMPLDALSQVVAMDLKGAWWDFIKSDAATTQSKCDKLGKLIRSDFEHINLELLNSANNELQIYLNSLMEQLFTVATGVLEAKQEKEQNDINLLEKPEQTTALVTPDASRTETKKPSQDLLAECKSINQSLKELEDICLKPYKMSEVTAP